MTNAMGAISGMYAPKKPTNYNVSPNNFNQVSGASSSMPSMNAIMMGANLGTQYGNSNAGGSRYGGSAWNVNSGFGSYGGGALPTAGMGGSQVNTSWNQPAGYNVVGGGTSTGGGRNVAGGLGGLGGGAGFNLPTATGANAVGGAAPAGGAPAYTSYNNSAIAGTDWNDPYDAMRQHPQNGQGYDAPGRGIISNLYGVTPRTGVTVDTSYNMPSGPNVVPSQYGNLQFRTPVDTSYNMQAPRVVFPKSKVHGGNFGGLFGSSM